MKKISTLTLLLSFIFSGSMAQTNLPAVITSDQTWTASGSPYIIGQNTYIDTGISVKVAPGVEIQSTNPSYKLIINGEFRAIGTKDSMILFNAVLMSFQQEATDYDSAGGKGTYFNYCHIDGPASGRTIEVYGSAFRFENCLFSGYSYAIYNSGSFRGGDAEIVNCTFNSPTKYSYPLYSPTSNSSVTVTGCKFNGGASLYCYGDVTIEDNIIDGLESMTFTAYEGLEMHCNIITNIKREIKVNAYTGTPVVSITNNTFDSVQAAMIHLYYTANGLVGINNNNFLATSATNKVVISGTNPNPATFKSIDFRKNYWETTDTTAIAGYIKDYTDDITIIGKVDYDSFLGALDTTCYRPPSNCEASFYVAIDTTFADMLFLINNSKGIKSTTKFKWTFGDGNSSTLRKPSHTYDKFGKYEVCLTLFDSASNCSSTYCDSLGLDSSGNLLKKDGFTLNVLDESDILRVPEMDPFAGMKVYPNPGKGAFVLEIPAMTGNMIRAQVMDLPGKKIEQRTLSPLGKNKWSLDMTDLNEGMYLIHIQGETKESTIKVIINR